MKATIDSYGGVKGCYAEMCRVRPSAQMQEEQQELLLSLGHRRNHLRNPLTLQRPTGESRKLCWPVKKKGASRRSSHWPLLKNTWTSANICEAGIESTCDDNQRHQLDKWNRDGTRNNSSIVLYLNMVKIHQEFKNYK